MPFILILIISESQLIVLCCGAGMLEAMWIQASLWYTGQCGEGCDMLLASLEAEFAACSGCPIVT